MKVTIAPDQAAKLLGLMTLAEVPRDYGDRPALCGVWLQVSEDGSIIGVAINGYVLGTLPFKGSGTQGELFIPNTHLLMRAAAWKAALKELWRSESKIETTTTSETVSVTMINEFTGSRLDYNYPTVYSCVDWKRVIPKNSDTNRRGVCFNPSYLTPYFQVRYGKNGDHHLLLDVCGAKLAGMRWYDLKDTTLLGVIMPLKFEREF